MKTVILALAFVADTGDVEILQEWVNPTLAEVEACVALVDESHFCEAYPQFEVPNEEHN